MNNYWICLSLTILGFFSCNSDKQNCINKIREPDYNFLLIRLNNEYSKPKQGAKLDMNYFSSDFFKESSDTLCYDNGKSVVKFTGPLAAYHALPYNVLYFQDEQFDTLIIQLGYDFLDIYEYLNSKIEIESIEEFFAIMDFLEINRLVTPDDLYLRARKELYDPERHKKDYLKLIRIGEMNDFMKSRFLINGMGGDANYLHIKLDTSNYKIVDFEILNYAKYSKISKT